MRAQDPADSGRGYIFAVFNERVRCDEAINDLATIGADMAEVHSFVGAEGASILEAAGNEIEAAQGGGGLLTRLANRVRGLNMDPADGAMFVQEARAGHCVLALPVEGAAQREHIGRLLQTHAASIVRYYGPRGSMERLAP